jgi:tetratricopeptide (TPR) repeat protein
LSILPNVRQTYGFMRFSLFILLGLSVLLSCSKEQDPSPVSLSPAEVGSQLSAKWDRFSLHKNTNFDSALIYMQEIKAISEQYDKRSWVATAYWAMGDLYLKQNNLSIAAYNFLNAATLFKELNKLRKVANAYNSIGDIYAKAKDYNTALTYFQKAKEIYDLEGTSEDKTLIYRNLAVCYREKEDYATAEKMLSIAKKAAQETQNHSIISLIYNIQGIIDFKEADFKSARKNYELVLNYADTLPDNLRLRAGALNNIGETFLEEGNHEMASQYLAEALGVKKNLSDPVFTQSTLNLMGRMLIEEERFEEAISLIEPGLEEVGPIIDGEVEQGLSLVVEALVKASAAPEKDKQKYLLQKFAASSKSLINYNQKLIFLGNKLESVSKQQAVQLAMEVHKRDVEIQEAAQVNQKIKLAFVVPVLFLLAAIISIYIAIRRNQRYKTLVAKIDEVLNSRKMVR